MAVAEWYSEHSAPVSAIRPLKPPDRSTRGAKSGRSLAPVAWADDGSRHPQVVFLSISSSRCVP